MYVAELKFKIIRNTNLTQAESAIRYYIEALIFNGQVLGREFPTAWQQTHFCSRVVIPDPKALHPKHHSTSGKVALEALNSAGLAYPQLTVLGEDLMSPHTDPCSESEYYILFTTFADNCSAVRCGEHFAPVPLYRLSGSTNYEPLIRWQLQFQALDEIQMQQQRVLARTAERSLQQLHSQLNRQGRQLARLLEKQTSKPFYYALYSGSSDNCEMQQHKLCPGCGNSWRLTEQLHQLFDFKCQQCRLVSNIAWECQ